MLNSESSSEEASILESKEEVDILEKRNKVKTDDNLKLLKNSMLRQHASGGKLLIWRHRYQSTPSLGQIKLLKFAGGKHMQEIEQS